MMFSGPVGEAGSRIPGRWRRAAECRTVPLATFFPDPYVSQTPAKAICQSCAVRAECLADAIATHEHHGIRGGFNLGDQRTRRRASRWLEETLKSDHACADTSVAS